MGRDRKLDTSDKNQKPDTRQFRNRLMLILFAVLLAYANHFENGFHFDDAHTITSNPAIQQVDIVRFFADGSTFSALPSNQSYRPWITFVNALDYSVRDGLYPGVFHVHIFLTFLICIVLLVFFVKKTLDRIQASPTNDYLALSVGAIFGLLTANAETVNYIIQRAEIEAGLFILAGFVAYLHGGFWRKWHLYMVFPVIGFFAKEIAFMFAPLLLVYLLIIEEEVNLIRFYHRPEWRKVMQAIRKAVPAFIVTLIFGLLYAKLLPDTFSTGSSDRWAYLITQPFVIGHYVLTFFVPYNLSADTDWTTFSSLADPRVWIGVAVVGALLLIALRCSTHRDTRPVSFGLLWFFITLAPTSSVIPLAEVLNDHRCFIPYMGLTIAVVFGVHYLLKRYFHTAIRRASTRKAMWIVFLLVLTANAYGVHERNKVWRDDVSLWKDVTEKSPGNGRGFMNYGLALMARGDYALAEANFLQAMKLAPDYSLVYVNLGILNQSIGEDAAAEQYFQTATRTATVDHQAYYYYGKFLYESGRLDEARNQLEMGLRLHPGDHRTLQLLHAVNNPQDAEVAEAARKIANAAKFLNLSLTYFNEGKYEDCIEAAERALEFDPNYAAAYNNIGIANVRLGRYAEGITAYRKALELQPDYELAKNNLAEAVALFQKE